MQRPQNRWNPILEGYARFLKKRELALPKHQPHLVRWVRNFLDFADQRAGYSFEQTLDLFLAEVGQRADSKPWQIQQAADAVRIYRHQYRASEMEKVDIKPSSGECLVSDDALLQRLQEIIRLRHYAPKTEKTYLLWAKKFLAYRQQTGLAGVPRADDVKAFLTRLATVDKVSASTQNQAFSALLLLFREVLRTDLDEMAQTVRAKKGRHIPTVLSAAEVKTLIQAVEPKYQLMVKLLYGSGLRLMELLRLRVKDLDFEAGLVTVRRGKGDKDRTTLLPASLADDLRQHLEQVRHWHEEDLAQGYGEAPGGPRGRTHATHSYTKKKGSRMPISIA